MSQKVDLEGAIARASWTPRTYREYMTVAGERPWNREKYSQEQIDSFAACNVATDAWALEYQRPLPKYIVGRINEVTPDLVDDGANPDIVAEAAYQMPALADRYRGTFRREHREDPAMATVHGAVVDAWTLLAQGKELAVVMCAVDRAARKGESFVSAAYSKVVAGGLDADAMLEVTLAIIRGERPDPRDAHLADLLALAAEREGADASS